MSFAGNLPEKKNYSGLYASAYPESLWVLRSLSAPGLRALQESPFGQHEGRSEELKAWWQTQACRKQIVALLKEKDVSFGNASKHS